ncbi:MAG: PEP-utilizing enzyme [Ilumatobacteraceae bacterium]
MLGDRWICDRVPTDRFPDYTRGNAGEVLAEPVSPLAWTFCWEPGPVQGCVDGFEQMGVFDRIEYGDPPGSFGLFGGYFYNSLTQSRLFGIRSGAGWEAIDRTFFDGASQAIPPYVEADWHADECKTKKLVATMGWVTTTENVPEAELQKLEAKALRDSRPDIASQTDEQLVARAFSIQRHLRVQFASVVWASMGSSVGPGVLPALLGEVEPDAIAKLMTGIGDVDSAGIATQIFDMSRIVRGSPELMAAFDADLDGLLDRLDAGGTPDAQRFLAAVDDFMYEHGGRGPNEWDVYQRSYETNPVMLLQALERTRHADDDADPALSLARGVAERQRLIDKYEAAFAGNDEALGGFQTAVRTVQVWMGARERIKSSNIRCHNEVRMCFDELGRRMVERGHLQHPRQIYMLLAEELDDFRADPGSFSARLADREQDYLSLYDLEPPYIVNGDVPPLSEWKRRGEGEYASVQAGDVLTGVAGSPGTATGRARVMLDLSDPSVLEPGDILIAPSTDPSWTPLFLVVEGVITDIGAVATHAVIVSRELGIPCVPSIADATKRIPDGATITIDGSLGTVTIDALP